MNKDIRDFVHFYFGGEGLWIKPVNREWKGTSVLIDENTIRFVRDGSIKLLLRNLSSMTEEEAMIFSRIVRPETQKVGIERLPYYVESFFDPGDGTFYKWQFHKLDTPTPEQFRYLLLKSFDLFHLIEDGLALDITKQPAQ